jgi:hypothetical protein
MIMNELSLEILMDLHVVGPPEYENGAFGMMSICIYIEQINGLNTYSIFKSLSIAEHFSANINILATINKGPSVGHQNKQRRYFQRGL